MQQNELYPIFLKVSHLNVLIVGGGAVALEKLTYLLKSSPNARVELVAREISDSVRELCDDHCIDAHECAYESSFLRGKQLVLVATDDRMLNARIADDAKVNKILVNVADTPSLCDFYLGGIVTKGNVKIAISTNGTSPTLAKRLRQLLEEVLPDNINELAENLNQFREQLKGDFQSKVQQLNELTKNLISNKKD